MTGPSPPDVAAEPSPENPLHGSCLCGGVRFEVTAPFCWASHCHCSRCRKHSGAFGGTQGRVPRDGVPPCFAGEELIRIFRPDGGRVKAFCFVSQGLGLFGRRVARRAEDGDPPRHAPLSTAAGVCKPPLPHLSSLRGRPGMRSPTTVSRATTRAIRKPSRFGGHSRTLAQPVVITHATSGLGRCARSQSPPLVFQRRWRRSGRGTRRSSPPRRWSRLPKPPGIASQSWRRLCGFRTVDTRRMPFERMQRRNPRPGLTTTSSSTRCSG